MSCGICGHSGQHAVTLPPDQPLPKPGQSAPLCADQCGACREQQRATPETG